MTGARANRALVAAMTAALLVGAVAATLEAAPKKAAQKKKGDGKRRQNPQPVNDQFEILTIAENLEQPSDMDFLPDGTLLVTEKAGKLYTANPNGDKKLILDISGEVAVQRERGLNGVAVAHDFQTSRRVYLLYAYSVTGGDGPQAMRLSYITLNDDNEVVNPGSPETVILGKDARPGQGCPPVSNRRDCPPSVNATHQGGTVIADDDGTLWLGFGDSNLPSNPGGHVFRTYNPASTSGKILHIDSEGRGLPNHPFCKKTKNLERTCTKVHAMGFRNPFRFTLTEAGDPIAGDVGWNLREEIDLVRAGKNYGWPCFEGELHTPFYREQGRCKALYKKGKKAGLTRPLYDYRNPPGGGAAGAAVIVGPHYPSGSYPDEFDDSYFFGDYAKAFIKVIKFNKGKVKIRPLVTGVGPVSFDLAPDGNLVFADFITGAVRKIVFASDNKTPIAQIKATPSSGPSPLDVQFSSAGTSDPEGATLTYDWDFGDGEPHSSDQNPLHTYAAAGIYTAKLTVTDPKGASASATTKITVGNTPPSATIVSPSAGTQSRVGTPVQLQATGTDAEDGALGPGAFSWKVTLFHKQHQHPLAILTGSSAQFDPVTDHDADSYYEITLTVTDSAGLATKLPAVTVEPESVPLKLVSKPKGVKLSYGGREVTTKKTVQAAIGFHANLSAPRRVEIDGEPYTFTGWSQGGRRVQLFTIPAERTVLKARYRRGG